MERRGYPQPSTRILEAVAANEGVEPADLDDPLYRAIDADALDDLFEHVDERDSSGIVDVTFTYAGYEIRIASDGTLDLE